MDKIKLTNAIKSNNLEEITRLDETGLADAIRLGNLEEVTKLVKADGNINVNRLIANYYTPVEIAILYRYAEIMEYLINQGADLVTQGHRALLTAISSNYLEGVKILLNNGVNINADPEKYPFLSVTYNTEIVRLLVKAGINVNQIDFNRKTKLHYAIEHNQAELVLILLSAGADVDIADNNGKTPFHYAVEHANRNTGYVYNKRYVNILKELLKYNPNNTIEDNDGKTPHDYADTLDVLLILADYQYIDPSLKEPDEIYTS